MPHVVKLPDPITRDERSRRWWSEWRSRDFSWASLATHKLDLSNGRQISLQEYWLRDPVSGQSRDASDLLRSGELVQDPTGRLWHLFHVPLQWADGSPTWKAIRADAHWPMFWDLVRARLVAANDDSANYQSGAPALLHGGVFATPPEGWEWDRSSAPLNANFYRCAFEGAASFAGVATVADLVFLSCLFSEFTDCDDLAVAGDLVLDHSAFLSTVWMKGVEVGGRLRMESCDFHGELTLVKARIEGETHCYSSTFHAPCLLEDTTFVADAAFAWCRFLDVAGLGGVRFRANGEWVENVFDTDFTVAGRCYGEFRCVGNRFAAGAHFGFMCFRGDAWFAECRFEGFTRFQSLRFRRKVSLLNAVFRAEVTFQEARFRSDADFHNVVFEGRADLTGCAFSADARCYHGAFRGADFRRNADVTIPKFHAWGAFIDTSFQQRLLLSRDAVRDDQVFSRAFEAAQRAAVLDADGSGSSYVRAVDRRFGELEQAFQALKQAMAQQQARLDEHRFYRLELLARRRKSESSAVERGIIRTYDLTSRCGTSFVRPLIALAALVLVFGLGYWVSTLSLSQLLTALNPYPPRPVDTALIDALRFSVENTLQPMSVWGKRFTEHDPREVWVQALLTEGSAWRYLGVRLVATVQSLCSIALLFLVVLGFKRHFQMNA